MARQFYALIEVSEWGEPTREQRVGPFVPEDPDADLQTQILTLEDNLAGGGDHVVSVEVVE